MSAYVLDLLKVYRLNNTNGAQPVAPMTLSFGFANGGHPVTSQTLLFRLPIELVQEVVTYLDTADLKSLALVDRDCRQLARSRLFASVVLDYSREKWQLLDELSREARARRNNGGASQSPSIGVCIRRLAVRTNSNAMASRHEIDLDSGSNLTREQQEGVIESYCDIYLPAIAQALRFSLPNLDGLEWRDLISIPQHLLTAIASSPIRHLGLYWVSLGPDYPLLPLEQRQRWGGLRSLDLWVERTPPYGGQTRVAGVGRFSKSFFEVVAPTLEKLSCDGRAFIQDCVFRFPRLRTLWFGEEMTANGSAIESFFPADAANCALRSVTIGPLLGDATLIRSIWKSLARRGHVRGLEVLNLNSIDRACKTPIFAFLSANAQLKSLLVYSYEPEFITASFLPFLASNLKFLTCLIVTLNSNQISPSTLDAIGRISSLKSLWIAVIKCSWSRKCVIDDPPSIVALSRLQNLTRLALSEADLARRNPRARRSEFGLIKYRAMTGSESQREWEDRHNERVRKVVERYVTVVSSLRWVYMGQLVHTVVGNTVVLEGGGMRVYLPGESWGISFC